MISVTDLQRKRIEELESKMKELSYQVGHLIQTNENLSTTVAYLTDEDFRKFAFRLNYDRLISHFLENEGEGDHWV